MFVDENKTRPAMLTVDAAIAELDAYLASIQSEAEVQRNMPGADVRAERSVAGFAYTTRHALQTCAQRSDPLSVFRGMLGEQITITGRACWTNDPSAHAAMFVLVAAWRKLNLLLAQTA